VLDDVAPSGDVVGFGHKRLLEPLGMRDTVWGRDGASKAVTYSGMESTCLDLARVGHLMLNQGSLDLVAVRLGARPASPERVTFDSFTAAVLAALPS
jgi:CubicO group peptidase (beta-lactamase class C family)